MSFNLADLFETVVDARPDREAMVAAERRLTYRQLDERSNQLAHHLADLGIGQGDHVGLQLLNGTEYIEGMLAAFKLRAVPINVNFRYVEGELRYLFDDADLVALIVNEEFADRAAAVLPEKLRHMMVMERDYEAALAAASAERDFPERSPDDIYIVYTGGTTGMPKGVMWRHEDIFFAALGGGDPWQSGNPIKRPEELVERITDPGMVALPAPPFMHASAHWLAFNIFFSGGTVVVTERGRFDPELVWSLVAEEKVNTLVIVGDAMARPLIEARRAAPDRHDTSSLMAIGSGGAILSASLKAELNELFPMTLIVDAFGSSETGTVGSRPSFGSGEQSGPKFTVNDQTAVFDDDFNPVEPGSETAGRLARRSYIPLGYYKDPDKTAATFIEVAGVRWVLPGDYATVQADGTVVLLGRGSVSINTGGEKVYPEEVEAVLKAHPEVFDAVVVGVTDERWGERVTAVVQPRKGAAPTLEDVQAFCRNELAGYKVPRAVCLVEQVVRSPSGKADYRWAKEIASN